MIEKTEEEEEDEKEGRQRERRVKIRDANRVNSYKRIEIIIFLIEMTGLRIFIYRGLWG